MTTGDESGLLETLIHISQTLNDTLQLVQRQVESLAKRVAAIEDEAISRTGDEEDRRDAESRQYDR